LKALWHRRPAIQFWSPAWHRLGRSGAFGIAALILAAILELGITPMWRSQAHAAEQAELARRTALADQRRAAREAKHAVDAGPVWPASAQRDNRLARLLQLAQAHGVSVRGVQQQPERGEAQHPVAWNLVTMPLRGNYGDVRAFVSEALQADEALALDSVRLRRTEGERAPVEAELTWSFAQAGSLTVRP
jgi:hypothetical protein